jgi:hypothetical protein
MSLLFANYFCITTPYTFYHRPTGYRLTGEAKENSHMDRSPPHFPTAVLLGPAAYFPSIIYSVVGSNNCMVKFGGDPCFGTLVFGRRGLERERNAMQYVGKPRASLSPPTSVEWT